MHRKKREEGEKKQHPTPPLSDLAKKAEKLRAEKEKMEKSVKDYEKQIANVKNKIKNGGKL